MPVPRIVELYLCIIVAAPFTIIALATLYTGLPLREYFPHFTEFLSWLSM